MVKMKKEGKERKKESKINKKKVERRGEKYVALYFVLKHWQFERFQIYILRNSFYVALKLSQAEEGVLIATINSATGAIAYQCITIDNIVDHVLRK